MNRVIKTTGLLLAAPIVGWKDLFVSNGHVYPQVEAVDIGTRYRQRCQVFRNLGDGKFSDLTSSSGSALNEPRAHRGAALGDLDNDGDLDILVMDLDGGPHLFEKIVLRRLEAQQPGSFAKTTLRAA